MGDASSTGPPAPLDGRTGSGQGTAAGPAGSSAPLARRSEQGSVAVLLDADLTLVMLAGDIDATVAPDLVEAAAEVRAAGRPVRIDTRNVTFMDSTGISFLARVAVAGVGRPVLVDPPDHVRFLLEITAIGELVEVEESAPPPPGDDAG